MFSSLSSAYCFYNSFFFYTSTTLSNIFYNSFLATLLHSSELGRVTSGMFIGICDIGNPGTLTSSTSGWSYKGILLIALTGVFLATGTISATIWPASPIESGRDSGRPGDISPDIFNGLVFIYSNFRILSSIPLIVSSCS